jgi:hypothetical protein
LLVLELTALKTTNLELAPGHYAGSTRVAMRTQDSSKAQDDIIYLFSDHLPLQGAARGSTTTTVNASNMEQTKTLYTAFGTERYTSGTTPGLLIKITFKKMTLRGGLTCIINHNPLDGGPA